MKTLKRRPATYRKGFTLAELMVVIVIIGLLATLVVPNVVKRLFTAQTTKAKADITAIAGAVEGYALENNGRFPDSIQELVTPDENGFTFLDRETVPVDPWGNEYVYEPPEGGTKFRVLTYGEDGVPGGEGKDRDIDNIMIKNGEV
jgi:general secretion pathway protein G